MEAIQGYDKRKTKLPDEPEPVAYCDICGAPVYEGDYLTDFSGEKWCDECLKDIRRMV